jgi:hypothetical protein
LEKWWVWLPGAPHCQRGILPVLANVVATVTFVRRRAERTNFSTAVRLQLQNPKYSCLLLSLSTAFAPAADLAYRQQFRPNNGSASSLHLAAPPGPVPLLCELQISCPRQDRCGSLR